MTNNLRSIFANRLLVIAFLVELNVNLYAQGEVINAGRQTAWWTTGNSGTNPVTNFIGTIDVRDFVIRTSNTERARILSTGNFGIGTTTPASLVDVSGDLALREGANITLANGANNDITLGTEFSYYRIIGPTSAFSVSGFAGGNNGQLLIITNASTQLMTIVNNATSTAANRIFTGYNADITIASGGSVHLIYNSTLSRWFVTAVSGLTGRDWSLLGNSGTNPTVNFIGTTDATDWVIRTNNIERARMTKDGYMGINVATPTLYLEVSSGTKDAIWGHSNNVGGNLGYETNISAGTAGTILGAGVYASNPSAGYTSTYAQSTGLADVAANINYSNVWIAGYNFVDNAQTAYNPPALYGQLNVTSTTLNGTHIAIRGYSNRTVTGNPGYTIGVQGTSNSSNQDAFAVAGFAFCGTNTRAGGYFESFNYTPGASQAYAYVGTTVGGTARKITGTNAVSEIIPTAKHGRIMLTCPESPEYWYQDYGTVRLVDGRAHIDLDPILADIVMVNEQYPIRVFATPVDMTNFNGISMMNRTERGFDIVELNGGNHTGTIEYQLIVKPKTGFGEGRFPQAPGPVGIKPDKEPKQAKAANQPDPSKVFYWPADYKVYNYNPEDFTAIGDVITAGPNAGKIKLGNGKYGDHLPMRNTELAK